MTDPLVRLDAEQHATDELLASLRRDFESVVAASADSNADDEHDPEGSTIAFERSQISALIEQAEHRLGEIGAARARVDDGSYGVCETCGKRIAAGRLKARPFARTCVDCARLGEENA